MSTSGTLEAVQQLTLAQLRQNPSAALRAVEMEGAEFQITNHGRPVARLVPIAPTGIASAAATAALMASLHPNPEWAAELEAERALDSSKDPWEGL